MSAPAPSSRYADLLGLVEQWRKEAAGAHQRDNAAVLADRPIDAAGEASAAYRLMKCADELAGLLREIGREQEQEQKTR